MQGLVMYPASLWAGVILQTLMRPVLLAGIALSLRLLTGCCLHFGLCKLLLNSPTCELGVVGFGACTVTAHSADYVLRPGDGFRLGRSALIWPSLSSGFCAVCDGVLDQPVGQCSAWDGLGPNFPCVGGIRSLERASEATAKMKRCGNSEDIYCSQRALAAQALEARKRRSERLRARASLRIFVVAGQVALNTCLFLG